MSANKARRLAKIISDVISEITNNKPEILEYFQEEIDKPSFTQTAVQYVIFVCANIELVLAILAYTVREEPVRFADTLNHAVTCSAAYNKIDIMKGITNKYPDVNLHYNEDYCLRIACKNGNVNIVRFLMAHGANPNIGMPNAIETARDNPQILALLKQKYNN